MTSKRKKVSCRENARKGQKTTYTTNSTQTSPQIIRGDELVVVIKRIPRKKLFGRVSITKNKTTEKTYEKRLAQILEEKSKDVVENNFEGKGNEREEGKDNFESKRNEQEEARNKNIKDKGNVENKLKEHNRCFLEVENQECVENASGSIASLTSLLKRRDMLSRLPRNYDTFIKPITNNQHVNSTLESISIDKDKQNQNANVVNTKCKWKSVNYIRPGPKCSKPKNYFFEDNRISIMLDNSNSQESASLTLSPIIERTNECTLLQDKQSIFLGSSISSELNKVVNIVNEIVSPAESVPIECMPSIPTLNKDISDISSDNQRTNLSRRIEPPESYNSSKGKSISAPVLNEDTFHMTSDNQQQVDSRENNSPLKSVKNVSEEKAESVPVQNKVNLLSVESPCLQYIPPATTENLNITANGNSKDFNTSEEEESNVENIQFSYKNYTTVIEARRNQDREETDECSVNADPECHSKKQKKRKRKKYIVIKADTVHIHNHFYKQ